MKVTVSDSAVPFVLTYRKILKKPKLKRTRNFVGLRQVLRNAAIKVIEAVEAVAFETQTEVLDPGESRHVNWAITVPDPFVHRHDEETNLVAFQMGNDMPPCGAHFEIISPLREKRGEPLQNAPLQQEPTREHDPAGREPRKKFVRPADSAYGAREVSPVELAEISPDDDLIALLDDVEVLDD